MIQPGINTRVGLICRTVQDAAKILTAYAGYDPKDELTVYSVDRMPLMPYDAYAVETRLDGVRIGVVRELYPMAGRRCRRPASDSRPHRPSASSISRASVRRSSILVPAARCSACVRKYAPKLAAPCSRRSIRSYFRSMRTASQWAITSRHWSR